MDRRTWEDVGIGVGALGLIAGGVYILDKQGLIHLPSFLHPSSSGLPTLNYAPQTLPSHVPVRCGTVFVSFGPSPVNHAYIIVGKYTNAKLVDQYYQPATQDTSFDTAGHYAGGYQCGNTSTSPGGSGSTSAKSAAKGWADIGNGCYVAQSGATLSGLAAALGTNFTHLAQINHISNPSVIQVGQKVGYPNACGSSVSNTSTPRTTTPRSTSNVNNIPNWTFYPPKCWIAQSGANLSTLSAYLGISVSQLVSWNHISNPSQIYVGERVCLQ